MTDVDNRDKVLDKVGELSHTLEKFRARVDRVDEHGKIIGEVRESTEKIATDLAGAISKLQTIDTLEKRLEEIEKNHERLKDNYEKTGVKHSEHRSAMLDYMASNMDLAKCATKTREFFESVEYRILTETTDTEGGYLVTPEIEKEIISYVTQTDKMRLIARIQSIGTDSYEVRTRTAEATAYWTDEETAPTESTPTYGDFKIPIHNLGVKIQATRAWLMDTWANPDQEIAESAGIAIAYAEGAAFVTGDGTDQPLGFMTGHGTDSTAYPANVSGKGTAALDARDFSELFGALKNEYWDNAVFVMNQNTLVDTMQLRDSQNQFLWQPGLQGAFPSRILGVPFYLMPTMEDISDGSYPIALGDFRKGYKIVDRIGILMVKDEAANFPKVIFYLLKRVGGRVCVPEAIKVLLVT